MTRKDHTTRTEAAPARHGAARVDDGPLRRSPALGAHATADRDPATAGEAMPSTTPTPIPGDVAFSVALPREFAAVLRRNAAGRGWTPESPIVDCVAQHLEVAIRHRVLIERVERIDAAILDMAEAVGELGAPSAGIDLTKVCRYRQNGCIGDASADPAG